MELADVAAMPFGLVVSLFAWLRVSIKGILHSHEDAQQREHKPAKVYVDVMVQNERFQGMHVRVWSQACEVPGLSVGSTIFL